MTTTSPEQTAVAAPELEPAPGRARKLGTALEGARTQVADRIAQLTTRNQPTETVFVLSGGGSRGAAQIGMIQALAEAGITPTQLVGTSVGALNAVAYAWQPTLERTYELAEKWTRLATRDVFGGTGLTKVNHLLRRHPYLYDNDRLTHIITTWVDATRLEDLALPVRVVTTHLGTGKPAYHDRGDLTQLLLASTALPGLFPPVQLPDPGEAGLATHVDGGVSDNVPLAGAVGLGPKHVYVLDVSVPPSLEQARSPLDVLVASFTVAMQLRPQVDFGHGVLVHHLHAKGTDVPITDFSRTRDLIAAGRETALEALAAEPVAAPAGRLKMSHGRIRLPRLARAND